MRNTLQIILAFRQKPRVRTESKTGKLLRFLRYKLNIKYSRELAWAKIHAQDYTIIFHTRYEKLLVWTSASVLPDIVIKQLYTNTRYSSSSLEGSRFILAKNVLKAKQKRCFRV